jgi:hypothetical protein
VDYHVAYEKSFYSVPYQHGRLRPDLGQIINNDYLKIHEPDVRGCGVWGFPKPAWRAVIILPKPDSEQSVENIRPLFIPKQSCETLFLMNHHLRRPQALPEALIQGLLTKMAQKRTLQVRTKSFITGNIEKLNLKVYHKSKCAKQSLVQLVENSLA